MQIKKAGFGGVSSVEPCASVGTPGIILAIAGKAQQHEDADEKK